MKKPSELSNDAIATETAAMLGWQRHESPSAMAYYDKGNGLSIGVPMWQPYLNVEQAMLLFDHWKAFGREVSLVGMPGENAGYLCLIDRQDELREPHAYTAPCAALAICRATIAAYRSGT